MMKTTVEKIRPLEQELGKLERKADHTKKEYRKAIQKDIRTVKLKISEMEENVEVSKTASHNKTLGIAVQNLTPEMARRLRLKSETGVVVTRVESGSPGADAGIQTGDIIREVNRTPVKNVADLVQKLEQAKDQNNILLLVQRGQNNMFAAVTPK